MSKARIAALVGGGLLVAVGLALLLSPFASQLPDGLEWVAEEHGFLARGEDGYFPLAPWPDYSWVGIESPIWSTGLAGAVGTLVVFGLTLLVGLGVRRLEARTTRS